jgi:hypothetical protein
MNETERKNKRADEYDKDLRGLTQAQIDIWWQAQRDGANELHKLLKELNPVGLRIWG